MRNPFTHPPRLSPTKRAAHSRSPSSSPIRQLRERDPVLRNLSPTNTLRAFVSHPSELTSDDAAALAKSIQEASHTERALGAKAAQLGLDVRSWTRELQAWEWPGTFEAPDLPDRKTRMSTITYDSILASARNSMDDEALEYWGSLPAQSVQAYEKRADEIGLRLDEIDMEELKAYVLSAHNSSSRPSSGRDALGFAETEELKRLDDYTAVVTATILQLLPYLSKIHQLLDVWTIRLVILRAAPVYLRDLKQAKTDLNHGWAAIAVSPTSNSGSHHASFSRETMLEMKKVVQQQVGSLGARLDRFLDDLEGRDDTVPMTWIDNFESLESAYGAWVVQAERKVLENEWREATGQPAPLTAVSEEPEIVDEEPVSAIEDPAQDVDAAVKLTAEDQQNEPANEQRSFLLDASDEAESRYPSQSKEEMAQAAAAFADFNFESNTADDESFDLGPSRGPTPVPDSIPIESPVPQLAKKRAAFLNHIERTNSLKQSKSPVRPFEHASNAFTRLFKKDRSGDASRSKSFRSSSSKGSSTAREDGAASPEERKSFSSLSGASSRVNSMRKKAVAEAGGVSSKLLQKDNQPDQAVSGAEEFQQRENGDAKDVGEVREQNHTPVTPKKAPETYRPTGLPASYSKPSGQPEFPENWPLVSPVTSPVLRPAHQEYVPDQELRDEQAINPLSKPMSTDSFDMMFVQSFPTSRSGEERATRPQSPVRRPLSLPRISNDASRRQARYLDNVYVGKPRAKSAASRPDRLQLPDFNLARPTSSRTDGLSPGSNDSNAYSPEIREAKIGYFSLGQQSGRPPSRRGQRPVSTPPTMPSLLKLHIPGSKSPKKADEMVSEERDNPTVIKRASVTSISAFTQSEVKAIDVSKSRHNSTPHTPVSLNSLNTSPINYKGMISFPTPPPRSNANSLPESPIGTGSPITNGLRAHPVNKTAPTSPAPPLNSTMSKRRPVPAAANENRPPSRRSTPLKAGEDTFDRHVSEVLERLPTGIKFKTRPGAETPRQGGAHISARLKAIRPSPRSNNSSGSGLTLAPADVSPKKSGNSTEPEVKLYHLTHAGRDEPIKLFVRLVGEGERVMVRVGGGWADLADYLRQYAEHHGSRTVSEGNVEIQPVSAPGSGTRKVSGPALDSARAARGQNTPSRPGSKESSGSSDRDWLRRPQPAFTMGDSSDAESPEDEGALLSGGATKVPPTQATAAPLRSGGSSRPSTADSTASGGRRPTSRQSFTEAGAVGLSGVRVKGDLPEQKAKWVEGMLERARQAAVQTGSAEKPPREDGKEKSTFAELGSVGGTRRVIFRSGESGNGKGK